MGTRDIQVAVGGVFVAAGGAAMFELAPKIWPHHEGRLFAVAGLLVLIGIAMFIWAFISARRERTMADDKKPEHKKTAGVHVMPGGKLARMDRVWIKGFDDAVRNEGEIGEINQSTLEGRNPIEKAADPPKKPRKYFGGFSFRKGDHLEDD